MPNGWSTRTSDRAGDPVEVTLLWRVSDNLPPGRQPAALPFVDQEFYTAPVVAR